jgi:hypothetical protein
MVVVSARRLHDKGGAVCMVILARKLQDEGGAT